MRLITSAISASKAPRGRLDGLGERLGKKSDRKRHLTPGDASPGFGPWDQFGAPGPEFLESARDFSRPSLLHAFIDSLVEAVDEDTGQRGPGFGRKLQGAFQKFVVVAF